MIYCELYIMLEDTESVRFNVTVLFYGCVRCYIKNNDEVIILLIYQVY